jgi:NhaC family Na+:H+ antiporter
MSGALIPWTTCGAFIAGALGVSTMEYLPYSILNIINPIMTIVLSYLGIFVLYENKAPKAAKATK